MNMMTMHRVVALALICGFSSFSLCAQQSVTTTGGSSNQVPKFSGINTIVNSAITENNGNVGIGTIDFGQTAFAPDNSDSGSSWIGQAGPQTHFRLSRAYCDKRSGSPQSASDQANFFCVPDAITIDDTHPPSSTPNKDFLLVPYEYGMAMEYPGVLETWNTDFSVHMNRRLCSSADPNWIDSGSCNAGGHLWVGDNWDAGGVFASAYATFVNGSLDRSRSFVLVASDAFSHGSHGDMLFALRDSQDNFRFQVGPTGFADDPSNYRNYTKARIDGNGKGYFDGGTQTGGADFAESMKAAGQASQYEPGDVMVIDESSDRSLTVASKPYSKLVAGIYSKKPGVLATQSKMEDPSLAQQIPLAIVGIVRCKVTTRNGRIKRGDLLVTSSTPGYAMKGTDFRRMTGAVVGKALENLERSEGIIQVLVALQ